MVRRISDDLASPMRENVLELLEKPYAGSRAFKYNHEDAIYVSNCHGTMAYVFGLEDSIVKESANPNFIDGNEMEELIEKYFFPSDEPNLGDLIAFYNNSVSVDNILLHTALLVRKNGKIFHQGGTGGMFESDYTIEQQQKSLNISLIKDDVEVRSYKMNHLP